MIQNNYKKFRNYFIPNDKKSNTDSQLLLLIDFYLLTFVFTIIFSITHFIIDYKIGALSVGISALLYLIGLSLLKKGLSTKFLSHYYIFNGGFLSIFATICFSGGLYSPAMPWLVLFPVAALLLFNDMKYVFIWGTTPIIIILFFVIASSMGYSAPVTYNLDFKHIYFGIAYCGLTFIIFLLSFIFKSFIISNLNQLTATQNQLIQQEKLASLGELTAGIAHEIQNPLNFVNNFSELSVELVNDLKAELKSPDKDLNYIDELFSDLSQNQEKINHHGKRASNIVKGMLEHSRTSNGERVKTDINALCDEYMRLSYHGMRAKDKSFISDFKTDLDPKLPLANIISQDIGRVLLNLINNAFYAVHQKSKTEENYSPSVIVSTKYTNNQIIIVVKDNGNGIPDSIKEKIFQPFFTTKPTGEGTGLGLSLSYDIITKGHGGVFELETSPNEFTLFRIKLPNS